MGFANVRQRAFCIMSQRVAVCGKVKAIAEAEAKASPNWASQSYVADPKPGDLSMGRLKRG